MIKTSYTKEVHQGTVAWLLSDTGYLFALHRWYGNSIAALMNLEHFPVPTASADYQIVEAKLYYESTNCTGQAYLSDSNIDTIAYTGFSPVLSVRGGLVFRVLDMSGTSTAYYLPKASSEVPIAYKSSRDGSSTICTSTSPTLLEQARAVHSNDISITGVSNTTSYAWPLTFGY
jgi:hypothetical protein